MTQELDQIFVTLKHQAVAAVPAGWQPLASVALSVIPILLVFPSLFALTTVIERKLLGRIQNRLGPNRVGPFGFLQPLADGLKTLTKEDLRPRSADPLIYFLAPLALVVPVLLAFAVLPYGRNMVPVDLDNGVLWFFAVGAATELAAFMAGWSSRSKYSMLGAMRAMAQMVSYEVPLILSSVGVIMAAGSLSTVTIVEAQGTYHGFLPDWYVFTPWGFAAFLLFLVAAAAESNRSPFDIPEGESEIVAGYYLEYSGFKFALFFLGEYLGLFAVCGLAITLFLGGWHAPAAFLTWVPSYLWFFLKLFGLLFLFIWVRGTLPRLRMDQLMNFAWKFMLPMALINLVVAGFWHFLPAGLLRWIIALACVLVPYVWLGKGLSRQRVPRIYRFAE